MIRLLSAMLVVTFYDFSLGECDVESMDSKVIGGKPAEDGQFPYQVSLRHSRSNQHFCGGSVMNPKWILTAGHCLKSFKSPGDLIVVVGTNLLSENGTVYRASKLIVHENYNDFFIIINDVGLIRTATDVVFTGKVAPIALNPDNIRSNVEATLSGWGLTRYPGNELPDQLQYIKLRTVDNVECMVKLLIPILSKHLCTYTKRGEGTCSGDSGGPLVVDGKQVGIVSFGRPCGIGYPDVFMRVSAYESWITANMD